MCCPVMASATAPECLAQFGRYIMEIAHNSHTLSTRPLKRSRRLANPRPPTSVNVMAATLRRVGAGPEMRHRGEQAAAAIGGTPRFVRADMADTESVKSLVQQCGDVDIIVNSAASFPAALTVEQDPATFETTFNTNVCGA